MPSSTRKILADSHIAAITIALLLFLSFKMLCEALLWPVLGGFGFVIMAVAIRGIPYIGSQPTFEERLMFVSSVPLLWESLFSLCIAWLLSRWIYRMSPRAILKIYFGKLSSEAK